MNQRSSMRHPLNQPKAGLRPMDYWWLWVLDTVLVTGACLFYLATQYGTHEFFGRACLRALLPLIPVLVLVGGAGSTVFVLTKVWLEKRGRKRVLTLALLIGQAVVVAVPLVWLGAARSPAHRLSYICAGHPPAAVSALRLAGYSQFLREEWLAVFQTNEKAFQAMVGQAQLVPADKVELQKLRAGSGLEHSSILQMLPAGGELQCYQRVFKPAEHDRGFLFAVFDPATTTAAVFRGYQD